MRIINHSEKLGPPLGVKKKWGRSPPDLAGLCGHLSGASPALRVAFPSRPRAMDWSQMQRGIDGFNMF